MVNVGYAQSDEEELQRTKNVSDTILIPTRQLIMPEPFDAQAALLKLFPGRYYKMKRDFKNELINWTCKTCKPVKYADVNEDAASEFPYAAGVATRLINVIDFKDAKGTSFKIMFINHSAFDEEGNQTSRFTGGLLGLAKFNSSPQGWKLTFFQPAIGAYGAFSSCPAPKAVLIGEDQYAFMIKHSNGGGGGPFDGSFFLMVGAGGKYQEQLQGYGIERTAVSEEEGLSSWISEYNVPVTAKKYFRDVIVKTKGIYCSGDLEGLPAELTTKLKKGKNGQFSFSRRYLYKAGKGYQPQQIEQLIIR